MSRDNAFPADSIGLWWLVFLNLYSTLPSILWWVKSGDYNPVFSQRLYRLQPSAGDVFDLLSIAAAYAFSFASTYWLLVRNSNAMNKFTPPRISNGKLLASAIIVLIVSSYGLYQNVSLSGAYYGDNFRQTAALSLSSRQLLKLVAGVGSVCSIVLLIGLLQRWPRYQMFVYVYVLALIVSFSPAGSRGEMFGGVFTLFILWHVLKRPLSTKFWIGGGAIGLLLFLLFGILRGLIGQDYNYLDMFGRGLGEFDQLWANAVEVYQSKREGFVNVSLSARFGELWAFVPSQLLPIEKQAISDWFLDEYYPAYKALGGGWAFGAIAQAAVGNGIFEALIRGTLLGLIFGYAFKFYRSNTNHWWVFPSYIYLVAFSFNSIRNSSFWFLTGIVQILIPALIVLAIGGALLNVNRAQIRKMRTGTLPSHS